MHGYHATGVSISWRLCAACWAQSVCRRGKPGAVFQRRRRLPDQSSCAGWRWQSHAGRYEALLHEIAPPSSLHDSAALAFRQHRLRIDPRAQVLVALLRHSLWQKIAEPLEAESLALTLVQRALGPRTTHTAGASIGRQRLVDRIKLVLASDLMRRWTLAEIAAEVRGSPVYLTQVFQQVEGLALVSISVAVTVGAGAGPSRAIRRSHCAKPGSWLLKPQSFQRRVPRSLWPLALGIQAFGAASLAFPRKHH